MEKVFAICQMIEFYLKNESWVFDDFVLMKKVVLSKNWFLGIFLGKFYYLTGISNSFFQLSLTSKKSFISVSSSHRFLQKVCPIKSCNLIVNFNLSLISNVFGKLPASQFRKSRFSISFFSIKCKFFFLSLWKKKAKRNIVKVFITFYRDNMIKWV